MRNFGSRLALPIAGALCAFSAAPTASAFDYPEHAGIASHALAMELASPDGADLTVLLDALHGALSPHFLCASKTAVNDLTCLSLADIPALSGDHSGSPLLLYWRWFDTCSGSPGLRSQAYDLLDVLWRLGRADLDPEKVPQGFPDVEGFIKWVHGPRSMPNWPVAAKWTGADDDALQGFDGAYASLAIDGHAHFRPGTAAFDYANASARMSGQHRPALTAYAWYADMHAGALLYARMSKLAAGNPQEAPLFGAAAMMLELSALHFLEDCVSAGHMVGLAEELDPGTLNVIHDAHCQNGTPVYVPPALCGPLGQPAPEGLEDACVPGSKAFTVLGDHAVSQGRTRDPHADLTFFWASRLVEMSLAEVVRARNTSDSDLDALAQDLAVQYRTTTAADPAVSSFVPHATGAYCSAEQLEGETRMYRALAAWWASRDSSDTRSSAIVSLLDLNFFSAARAVPIPALDEVDGRTAKFTGLGLFVEADALYPGGSRFTVDPEVVFGGEFAAPRNRAAGFQLRVGAGLSGHTTSTGESALVTGRIAAREFLTNAWFLEQQVEGRAGPSDDQLGPTLGTGILPFERIGSAVSFSANAGPVYDWSGKRVLPLVMVGSQFVF